MCRFLLENTPWPDKQGAMLEALPMTATFQELSSPDSFVSFCWELYIEEHGLDMYSMRWIPSELTVRAFRALERASPLSSYGLYGKDRIERASHCHIWSRPRDIFSIAGIDALDPGFPSQRRSEAQLALILVAHQLAIGIWPYRYPLDMMKEWFDLGVRLIKNGVELSNSSFESTAFYHGFFRSLWSFEPVSRTRFVIMWARMAQEAGIDLSEYGKALNNALSKPLTEPHPLPLPTYIYQYNLLYGQTLEEWSVRLRRKTIIRLFELEQPPGSFPIPETLPSLISWYPNENELLEGRWKHIEGHDREILSSPWTAREESRTEKKLSEFECLIACTQDDAFVVALMAERLSRPTAKPRSYSQPPSVSRRESEHHFDADKTIWPDKRRSGPLQWAYYHLCPFDWRYSIGCLRSQEPTDEVRSDNVTYRLMDLRSCVKGIRHSYCAWNFNRSWLMRKYIRYLFCDPEDDEKKKDERIQQAVDAMQEQRASRATGAH